MFPFDLSKILDQFAYHRESPILFSSGLFLFLFLGFFAVYNLLRGYDRARIAWVTLFSLYFYYKCAGIFWLLHVIIVVVDYNLARWMYRAESHAGRVALLIVSLIVNLGMLVYFKYTNYFFELWSSVSGAPFHPLDIFLPAGISFFTFQSLSYTIDVYRRELKPVDSMLDYAFFVTFFPQMLAGPIVRAADFLPQIHRKLFVSREDFGRAVFLFCAGLFKKAVISDYISLNFVDRIFDSPDHYTGFENLLGVYGYALQIYCDFSGYSDMAIALALMMGFHFPLNFNSPYRSLSVTEFWRRWHISLSSWLRDYLYIPLGGNRKNSLGTWLFPAAFFAISLGIAIPRALDGEWWWLAIWAAVVLLFVLPPLIRRDGKSLTTNFNLLTTMLLGGLWHGAATRFILWGALHGIALAAERQWKALFPGPPGVLRRVLGALWTFHFVCFCWIFFRAQDMETAGLMLTQIGLNFHPEVIPQFLDGYAPVVFWMAVGYLLHLMPASWERAAQTAVTHLPLVAKALMLTLFALLVMQVKSSEVQPFIYFQF